MIGLKNHNPRGDPSKSPRCGARTRSGRQCRAPAMKNKHGKYTRCRLHGGASTGPRTAEGLERSRKARWKHGRYSAERKRRRRESRHELRSLLAEVHDLIRAGKAYLREREREARKQAKQPPNVIIAYPAIDKT